jgi:hypothetical protein
MTMVIGVALGMLIGGLLVCMLSPNIHYPVMVKIVWWIGLILALCGALLLLTPILIWITAQLRAALGV